MWLLIFFVMVVILVLVCGLFFIEWVFLEVVLMWILVKFCMNCLFMVLKFFFFLLSFEVVFLCCVVCLELGFVFLFLGKGWGRLFNCCLMVFVLWSCLYVFVRLRLKVLDYVWIWLLRLFKVWGDVILLIVVSYVGFVIWFDYLLWGYCRCYGGYDEVGVEMW